MGGTITVAEVLDRSAKELQGKFADDPATKAKMLQAIGESYYGLGLVKDSIPLLEQARDLFVRTSGPESRETLAAMSKLAEAYNASGRIELAESPDTLRSMYELGQLYCDNDRGAAGVPLLEQALKLQSAKLGSDHANALQTKLRLAVALFRLGRRDEAISLLEQVLKVQREKLGPCHPETRQSWNCLYAVYLLNGRTDDAVRLLDDTRESMKTAQGADLADAQHDLAADYGGIGMTLMREGKTAEAAHQFARALDQFNGTAKWLEHHALCRQLAHNDDVFGRVAKLRPLETTVWIGRGENHALRGEWAQAVTDYAKVIDRRPMGDDAFEYAGLLLLQGKKEAYQRFCEKLAAAGPYRSLAGVQPRPRLCPRTYEHGRCTENDGVGGSRGEGRRPEAGIVGPSRLGVGVPPRRPIRCGRPEYSEIIERPRLGRQAGGVSELAPAGHGPQPPGPFGEGPPLL